jgi:hypothetical protein
MSKDAVAIMAAIIVNTGMSNWEPAQIEALVAAIQAENQQGANLREALGVKLVSG